MGGQLWVLSLWCAFNIVQANNCASIATDDEIFKDSDKWLAFVLCGIAVPSGFLLLFFGVTMTRRTRIMFGFIVTFSLLVWILLVQQDTLPVYAIPLVCVPFAFIGGHLCRRFPSQALVGMGVLFGAWVGFTAVALGLYLLWDSARSPALAIITSTAVLFALLIHVAQRRTRYVLHLIPIPGRRTLLPAYTALMGAVALCQPINYVTVNNIHAQMIFNCTAWPDPDVYIFFGLLYTIALIGATYQIVYGPRTQIRHLERQREFLASQHTGKASRWQMYRLAAQVYLTPPQRKSRAPSEQLQDPTNLELLPLSSPDKSHRPHGEHELTPV